MLKRFLPIFTFLAIATSLMAQVPEPIAPTRPTVQQRSPLACGGVANAGVTTRNLGLSAKSNEKHYLCIGDTLFVNGSGANLSEDPVATTTPGIGYLFYNCQPTVSGQRWSDVKLDPCLTRLLFNGFNGSPYIARGNVAGRDTFFNNGALQTGFNSGKPVKFYFAPITVYNFFGQGTNGVADFESDTACVNVNVSNGIPADTFSVVYLNAVKISNLNLTTNGGSFTVNGGLPEYDRVSNYTFTIALQSNPSVNVGTVTSGPASNGSTVNFTVPGNGVYIITARDGKACDGIATANFPVVTIQISNESVNQNDTACVRISARGFTNILSWECNYQYNPALLQFIGLKNINLPNLSNIPNINYTVDQSSGLIVFSWNVSSIAGISRPDDATLFEMCFKAIGPNGSSSTVCMTDSLNPIDIYNAANDKLGVNRACGLVRIGNAMTIQLSNETVAQGDTACVTVSAKNFMNITSIEGNFQYNPSLVQFIGIRGINLPGLGSTAGVDYNILQPGVLAFSWYNSSVSGVTRADNVGLFQLCFKAIGPNGSISPVRFTDTLNPIDIYNSSNIRMGVTRVNGSITIGSATYVVRVRGDSVKCNGTSTGGFRVIPTGSGSPWSYSWQNATNPGQNGSGTIALGDSARVSNLPAGKYYVTITNSIGTDLKVDSVTIFQPNPLFINPPTFRNPTCANDSDGSLTLSSYGGGIAPYTFRWSTGATTTSITNLTGGAYTCVITDANGCKDSVRASIGVNDVTIATKNVTGATCKGVDNGSIVISGITGGTPSNGNYTFRWSNGRTNVGTSSSISNLAPGTYRVTISDLNQCTKIDSFVVTAQRVLNAVATIGNITCAGQTNGFIQVIASAIGPEAQPYTFNWWSSPGTPTNTAATTFLSGLAAGNYPLSIRDRDGCSLDTAFVISQPDSIKITSVIQNESCRVGSDGRITLTITGGKPLPVNRYTIRWSRGGAADTTATITGLVAGSYTVTISDSTNCTTLRTFTITKPQPPIIDSISVRNATCSDKSDGAAKVFARAPAGATLDSFRWSNTGFRDSINNVLPGIYSVTVTTNQGCTATLADTIGAPLPLAIDTARSRTTNPDCPGNETGIIILVMKGGTGPYVYNWSGGPTTSAAVFASLKAGTYSFTITDVNSCTPLVHSVTLSDPPKIDVDFGSLEAVSCNGKCNPGDGKAVAIASGGTANTGKYTFIWSSGETSNNSNTSNAVSLCGGWQQVSVTDGNCAVVDSVEIPQPAPFSFFTPIINQPSCHGDRDGSAEIRVQGGSPPYSYFWSTGSNRNSIVNVPTGTYSVLITDSKLCAYNYSVNITEPDIVKLDTVAGLTNNVTCNGLADGQIKVKRTGGNGGPTNFIWSPTVSQTDSAGGLKAGAYSIVAYDIKGCGDSIEFNLTQPDPIYFYMTPPEQPRCNGELTTLRVDTAFGSTYLHSFSISVDNGPQYPIGYFIPVFAGPHQISIIEQITGCTLDTSVTITEPPSLLIQFDSLTKPNQIASILVGLGDSVRMLSDPRFFSRSRIVSALPIDSVSWTPKDYLYFANGDSLRPYVRPLDDRTYKLTIFDVNGCSTSELILVELDRNRNVFIPNIFSPNGDDRNDYFGVATGPGVRKVNYVRIFDRWGELLFTKENIPAGADPNSNGWDGSFRNRTVESGVYVYLVEVEFEDGQKLLYRGDVTVVK